MNNNQKIAELSAMANKYIDFEVSRQFAQFCRQRKIKMTKENYKIFLNSDTIDFTQAQKIFKLNKQTRKI